MYARSTKPLIRLAAGSFARNTKSTAIRNIIVPAQSLQLNQNLNHKSKALLSTSSELSNVVATKPNQSILNAPETQVTTLENGMRVASIDSGLETCTVGVYIDAGSRYESPQTNGVAHFLEHMSFKGTTKRSQAQLEQEIESLGAQISAETSRDQTVYYAKCLSKDVEQVVEILSDILMNPKLDESEFEKERKVILRELQDTEQNHKQVLLDHLHTCAFQGTPLGLTVLGPTSNIKSMKRERLLEYMNSNIKAPRMVLAGAGGVSHQKLVELGNKYFSKAPVTYDKAEIPDLPTTCRFTGSEIRVRDDSMPWAHVAIAIEGPGADHSDNISMMVAEALMGSWDRGSLRGVNSGNVLASNCHNKEGFHSYSSFNICYADTSLWGCYFVVDRFHLSNFTFLLQETWMRLCNSITNADVNRAKNELKTRLHLSLEGTTPICHDLGRQLLVFGRRIPLDELEARIDSIDAKKLNEVCTRYIYNRCPAIAALGPVEALPDYARIRSSMYWLRV